MNTTLEGFKKIVFENFLNQLKHVNPDLLLRAFHFLGGQNEYSCKTDKGLEEKPTNIADKSKRGELQKS